jgi:small redox-active disulfide protein 2
MNSKIESIQVLGSGCPTCKKLFEATKTVAADLQVNVSVEYITDITKMIELGIITSPALVVNGNAILTGGGHGEAEIKNALENILPSDIQPTSGCCCGGNC